jgi:DME family drug/metabolite transporter
LGVAAAALAGAVYALLNVTIRHSVTRTALPCAVAFLVPLTGAVSLGPIALVRSGVPALSSASVELILLMAAAGLFNIIGFLAFIYGLQRTTVVYANAVNASQVAMAAVAGMTIFAEPPNPWLLLGIGLTIVGIVWIDRPAEAFEDIPPP